MKKSLILILFIFTITLSSRAQYVAIPDSNFGNWLNTHGYASCLTGSGTVGWQINTTCSSVQSNAYINCSYSNIHDLTGIEYFSGLTGLNCADNHISFLPNLLLITYLNCSGNQLTNLPILSTGATYLDCQSNQLSGFVNVPDSLTYFLCRSNQIRGLSSIPSRLTTLDCSYNPQLTSLPSLPQTLTDLNCSYDYQLATLPSLPTGLITLNCYRNNLTTLPSLPTGLTSLYCSSNHITALPSLPSGLITLSCDDNQLTVLPSLPSGLTTLGCSTNPLTLFPILPAGLINLECSADNLTTLPSLPTGLSNLSCDYNQLTVLPNLPIGLTYLICDHNQLTALPNLPVGLTSLYCDHNLLSVLPNLPYGLSDLNCSHNQVISCLPRIYQNYLSGFYISGTSITCLANRFTASYYDVNPDTMPLCSVASGCEFYYNIEGNVHFDTATTCIADSLYPAQPIHNMKVQLKSNGQVVQQFYTFGSGGYSFKTDSLTSYTVSLDTAALPIAVLCPASGIRPVSLSPTDSVEKYQSFGMNCSAVDFGVSSIYGSRFRTTFTSQIHIVAGNLALMNYNANCGTGVSGTVTTTLTGSVHYLSPAAGALSPTSVSGNILTYTLTDLSTLQPGSLDIILQTDTGAVAGTQACINVLIVSSAPDANLSNNSLTQCFNIVNSWDPNLKQVFPIDSFSQGQWLTYGIEFQNTGSDTAYTVVVRDTLSPFVDPASFQYLASDHRVVIQLFGNAMVFTFPKINLVDSATNPPFSTGWIQYKVRARANLPLATQITNTASIYFDLNPAVFTNTTLSTLLSCTNVYDTISRSICAGDSFSLGAYHHITAGTYTDTLTAFTGCDSIVTLHLSILPLSYDTISRSICAGDSFSLGAYHHITAGTYTDTLTAFTGCDSIVTLHLSILPLSYDTLSHSICAGDSFTFAGHSLTTAATYQDTLTAATGCDSIIILNLSINPLPVVTLSWDSLLARNDLQTWNGTGWYRFCNPYVFPMAGGMPLGGHYSAINIYNDTIHFDLWPFPPYSDTISYVYIDNNGCKASVTRSLYTSYCEGINDISANPITLYPNPNLGTFTLQTSHSIGESYTISDMLGHIIEHQTITADSQIISLPSAAQGIYTMSVRAAPPLRFTIVR